MTALGISRQPTPALQVPTDPFADLLEQSLQLVLALWIKKPLIAR